MEMKKAFGDKEKSKEFFVIKSQDAIDSGGKYIGDFKKGTNIRHGKGASIWNLSDQSIVAGLTWGQRKTKAKTFTGNYQSWNVSKSQFKILTFSDSKHKLYCSIIN